MSSDPKALRLEPPGGFLVGRVWTAQRRRLLRLCRLVDVRLQRVGGHFKQFLRDKLIDHKEYIVEYGDDMPEIKNWKWPY